MATTTKLPLPFNNATAHATRSSTRPRLTFGEFFKLIAKSLEMVRAIPNADHVSAKDMEKIRRLVETL